MSNFEDAKGRVKQAAGDLSGNETLEEEGEAQSHKSQAERQASGALAEAQRRGSEAAEAERRERAAQEAD